jgi:peptidoglycan/xylan/chitin deacetylase (PgdA/CDA1 family)
LSRRPWLIGPRLGLLLCALAGSCHAEQVQPTPPGPARTTLTLPRTASAYGTAQYGPLPLQPAEVVLTFDDGPRPESTPLVLNALRQAGLKATFFMNGEPMLRYPDLARQVLAEGHSIGMHGFSHPNFNNLSPAEQLADLKAMQAAYRRVLGQEPAAYRFPFLAQTPTLLAALQDQSLCVMSVDVGIEDWLPEQNPSLLADRLLERLTPTGGIVLLHDAQDQTAQALPTLLQALTRRGFRVVHLDWAAPQPETRP